MVLAVPLVEVSAKTRTGFAVDDGRSMTRRMDCVLPFAWPPGTPIADPRAKPGIPVPANIQNYKRPQ